MFSRTKQVFILLVSFSTSLARDQTKCLFLNDEPCMAKPTLIEMNLVEPKNDPIIISLNKCTENCNVLSSKICVQKQAKANVKAFNMITNKNEAKNMTVHISCDCKRKFKSTTCNSKQKWNNKTYQCECKIIVSAKKIIVGIVAHVFVRKVSI